MLISILVISAVCAVVYFAWKSAQPKPILKIKEGVQQTVATTKKIVDVNNDGKVDVRDAAKIVTNIKSETKRAKKKYGGKVKKKKTE
jgi:hypothetical protein